MEKELPKNWIETELGNLITLMNGYAFKSTDYCDIGTPIIRMSDIENNEINILKSVRVPSKKEYDKFVINKGDILIGMSGSIGKYGIFNLDDKVYLNQRVGNLRLISENHINKKLIYYFIGQFQKEIAENAYGGTVPNISGNQIEKFNFKLPPLAEQNRIVAKLDSLFAQSESIKTSIAKIPVLLKNFRQQVLTQAVTGKLTEEWRKTKELEDWKEGSIEDFLIKKGIFDGPFGSHLKTEDYLESGNVRVIRLENIDSLKFNDDKSVYVSDEKYTRLIRHEVFEGDIIFSSFISERIRACILPFSAKKMIAKADCFCLRNDKQVLNTEFFSYVLVNPLMFEQLLKEVRGATRPRINTTILRKSQIIVPPIKEQQEIVNRVESLFARADVIEEKYKNLKAKIETLPQTILHKAFKGELTEQLETDGDARVLLEEIVALKNGEKPKKVVSKKYLQPDEEVLRIVAEPEAVDYHTKVERTTDWYDQRFELWVSKQGLAARGTLDKATLRELFDAMDDEDK